MLLELVQCWSAGWEVESIGVSGSGDGCIGDEGVYKWGLLADFSSGNSEGVFGRRIADDWDDRGVFLWVLEKQLDGRSDLRQLRRPSSKEASRRPRMKTFEAPLTSRALAIIAPMPDPPPVITKTMSFTENRFAASIDDILDICIRYCRGM